MKNKGTLLFTLSFLFLCLVPVSCGDDGDENGLISGSTGKKVKSIEVYKDEVLVQTIRFYYTGNRISSADYSDSNYGIIGPDGIRVFYNINGRTMTISGCLSGKTKPVETLPGKGTLNSHGLLEEQYFENSESEINSGNYNICRYEHNDKGQLTAWYFYSNSLGTKPSTPRCTYKWESDCIASFTGNPGGAGYTNPTYTNIENKANINLNWMILDQIFQEDIYGLSLCGYLSVKDKYLLDNGVNWTLDKKEIPIKAEYKRYTYVIKY